MYVPAAFCLTDRAEIFAVIRRASFAAMVTVDDAGEPALTWLPFTLSEDEGENGTLYAHFARGNPQWRDLLRPQRALVSFLDVHGYVSPAWYAPGSNVPTWNYIAVEAAGRPEIVEDETVLRAMQRDLVRTNEMAAGTGWSMDGLDERYMQGMLKGVVGFRLPIERLEAKAKLSQNRTPADRAGVLAGLDASAAPGDLALAAAMRRHAP